MSTPAIHCEQLRKSYGGFEALHGLDLEVAPGEIFAFLGPNGAGKTTTIRLLTGMLNPSAGSARIFGRDCLRERAAVMAGVGYLPDQPLFHDYLRGREILAFVGRLHGLGGAALRQRIEALLSEHGLEDDADEFASNYSLGTRKRLGLACAQLHAPALYILDEPVAGLDPLAMRRLQDWMQAAAAEGATVFLSTHQLEMAQRLAHRIGIIQRGQLQAVGSLDQLRDRLCPGGSLEEVFFAVAAGSA